MNISIDLDIPTTPKYEAPTSQLIPSVHNLVAKMGEIDFLSGPCMRMHVSDCLANIRPPVDCESPSAFSHAILIVYLIQSVHNKYGNIV